MYIDPTFKIMAHLDRIGAWDHGSNPAPVNIEWDLSNRCSLGCRGCHFGYTHTRGPLTGKMDKPQGDEAGGDLADLKLVKRALRDASKFGVKSVTWTGGGEPTLHPQFDEVIRYTSDCGLEQGLYTHGAHINTDRGRLLSNVLKWAVVSLDCIDAESYAAYKQVAPLWFDRAVTGIKSLVNGGGQCVVGVSFLIDANNWRQMRDMLAFARSLGASYTTFRPMVLYDMTAPGKALDGREWISAALPLLSELHEQPNCECLPERFIEYRDWRREYQVCYGVRFSATITPNGKVWLCPNRREFPESCLGDLNQESFDKIWLRHSGQWTQFDNCRVLCRLHMMNKTLATVYAQVYAPHEHINFI